jgi:hypothetical protein
MSTSSSANVHLTTLKTFRQSVYESGFGHARDALFELTDAVLLAPAVNSFAEFSLQPSFRRRWPMLYEALQDGSVHRDALLEIYCQQIPHTTRPLLAGDHTAWPRLHAPTLRERTVEHQPNAIPQAQPITVGQGYSTIAWLPEAARSWALPCLHERIAPTENPIGKAVTQLRAVCQRLRQRPIALFDAEYGCAPFIVQSADIACDKIVRLRPNLCLRSAPPPYSGKGRPRVHGAKFKLNDSTTWDEPAETLTVEDAELGRVRLSLWHAKHFTKAPTLPFSVLRIERLQAKGTRRDPKDVWLGWWGEPPPPLSTWWRSYLRRYGVDHWYRFAKQGLHWTLPHLKTPEQSERWSDLMPLLTWQLWLARQVVVDKPLPWQKGQVHLTPGRVRQSFGGIIAQIGTPTGVAKPRGKSPGWPKGKVRQHAPRYPIVKKSKK